MSCTFIIMGHKKRADVPFEELYDTLMDPFEMNNLVNDENHQHVKIKLKEELFIWMNEQGDYLSKVNSLSPFFNVWRHNLDEQSEQFNYEIDLDKVGKLNGKRENPHNYGF